MLQGYQDINVPPRSAEVVAPCSTAIQPREEHSSNQQGESSRIVQLRKLHEVWPGRNRPVCCGSCLMGPDRGVWIVTITLILAPTALFVLIQGTSPSIWVSLLSLVTLINSLYFLFRATFTEPGIVPRTDVRKEHLNKLEQPPKAVVGRTKSSQREIDLKYCETCHIWRPLRSKHCRDCDNCVEKFDHHCPWVCNCVGKRNYRFFIAFIFSTTVHCCVVFFGSLSVLITAGIQSESLTDTVASHAVSSGIVMYCFFIGWCLCSLSGYHLQLITSDTTTNEEIKGYLDFRGSKEGSDCNANCYNLFCTELPESHIDLNQLVDPEAINHPGSGSVRFDVREDSASIAKDD